MKRLLMIAFHFPPLAGSSGIQRTLRFVQQLPRFGWEPLVLTVQPHAYVRTSPDQLGDIPGGTIVERAFALDTARHLALKGAYIAALARPDRWASWRIDAGRRGLALIKRLTPAAIWSTYPIATAHLIGADLQRRSSLPWVADFRDPMAQPGYPADQRTWQSYRAIEDQVFAQAAACTFTTPSALRDYGLRFPQAAPRLHLLENGYDEDSFAAADVPNAYTGSTAVGEAPQTLLHSGIVYPEERDPTALMGALRLLRDAGRIGAGQLRVRFRAPTHGQMLLSLAANHGVADLIEVCPAIGYREALREMAQADGLLVMQGANCNAQVPAKIYEYLRARRPILCLADPAGDTAAVARSAGIDAVVALESAPGIAGVLDRFLDARRSGDLTGFLGIDTAVRAASRLDRAEQLARHLERITA
jgi:hypothetical protein